MDFIIREFRKDEYPLLKDFLYDAIFVPDNPDHTPGTPPERSVIYSTPLLYNSFTNFGSLPDDYALAADVGGKPVGAVWMRIVEEYGHYDDQTPSLTFSVKKEYRRQGIGTALLAAIVKAAKEKGYKKISLSCQKANFAVKIYQKAGFEIVGDGADDSEYMMIQRLNQPS